MRIVKNAINIILEKRWLQPAKRWLQPPIDHFLYGSTRHRGPFTMLLQKKMNKCNNLKDYVRLAYGTFYMSPGQVIEEIIELLDMLAINKPKFILEIGTARGGTLFLLSRVASSDASIISLDLPGGAWGGGYFSSKIPFYKTFAARDQKMYFILENSHSPQTFQLVQGILKGRKLDFLFIDGDHTYYGVKKDFEMYSKLVRKSGMIAFHDVSMHDSRSECEVAKFWRDIKDKYKHVEIIKDQRQGWAGIGILYI